ncbi:MAG: ArgE/DapE family deacylase [Candidatus Omnitrophota bacterium]
MINKKRLTALTQKLIGINSENPPGREWDIAEFIRKDMLSLGLDVKTYTFQKKRPNIVATLRGKLPRKVASSQAILLSPHIDTVPAGKGWRFGPFSGKIHQGKIYGRGASDDKGNLACCMEVLRSLMEDGVSFQKDIIMAATADEETGSHFGIVPLLAKKILKPKAALIMDSDEFHSIIAQKGLIHCRVQIFGKKAHGAYNWRGINAIEQAGRIINQIKQHKFSFKKHTLLHAPTVNVGTIKGGDKVNMVADFCEFSLDFRYLPGTDPKSVLNILKKTIRSEAKKFKIIIDDLQYPYEIDTDHSLVKTFSATCKKMGFKSQLTGSEGATVISFFKRFGIPAIATGFAAEGTAHITDEYAVVNDLYHGSQVLEQFLKDYDQI